MDRRLLGRAPAGLGIAAAIGLLVGCATTEEVVQVCATRNDPPVRVDDNYCERPANRGQADNYMWYQSRTPEPVYDYDNESYIYPVMIAPNVGQPLAASGSHWSRPAVRAGSAASKPVTVVRPPAQPAQGSKATTITRGGLGVSAGTSSSGS